MRTKLVVLAVVAGVAGRAAAQPPQNPPAAQQPAPAPPSAPAPRTPEVVVPKADGAGSQQRPVAPAPESYVIGPQDNLSIIVTDETDLTGKYRVDTDGTISMPYIQRVPVAGLLSQVLAEKVEAHAARAAVPEGDTR